MSQMPDKGMYCWRPRLSFGGDPKKIAESLNAANIKRFDVKVVEANRIYKYWSYAKRYENVTPEWLEEFRKYFKGKVMGWGFCYGHDAKGEGRVAAEQVSRLNLDYYGFNVESVFERQTDAATRATHMMRAFRLIQPDIPTFWISWPLWKNPYPGRENVVWHYSQVAKMGMQYCQFGMPMIYYPNKGAYWAKFWLEKSLEQWKQLVTDKPIIPVGRLYTADGGVCDTAGIEAFGSDVRIKYKLLGESWWVYRLGLAKPDWWKAMSDLKPFVVEPKPTVPIPVWRTEVTLWLERAGYDGPWPELEE